jgi:crotonobetainyl-CoA:carnitine CoA-transferase CaiB-like acyl-CoA transferase
VPEALAHPQVQALGILAAVPGQDFALTALPLTIDGQRPLPRAAPRLGASTMRRTAWPRCGPIQIPKETS